MGRVLLQAADESLSKSGINALLNITGLSHYQHGFPPNNLDRRFPFEDVSALMQGIDMMFGPRGGRAYALRIGRSAFKYGLNEFGPVMGIADLTVRLLPWSIKLEQGASSFANLFNQFTDQIVRIENTEEALFWHIERCPLCWGRHVTEPRCFVAAGLLEESLRWLSGGRHYTVEQISCCAMGEARCSFAIHKKNSD